MPHAFIEQRNILLARDVLRSNRPLGGMSLDAAKNILRFEIGRIMRGGTPIPDLDSKPEPLDFPCPQCRNLEDAMPAPGNPWVLKWRRERLERLHREHL